MASSSSTSSVSFSILVTEKLTLDNFLVWRVQILPAVRGARLFVCSMDLRQHRPQPFKLKSPTNLQKEWRILLTSNGFRRINKCCHISSPPWPKRSWSKLPPSNMLLRSGRQLHRCFHLNRSRASCIYGLSSQLREKETARLQFFIPGWRALLTN